MLNVTKCSDQFSILIILTVGFDTADHIFFLKYVLPLFLDHYLSLNKYLLILKKIMKDFEIREKLFYNVLSEPAYGFFLLFIDFDLVYNNKSWKTDNKANDS